jgi:hypothetical protein
MRPHTASVSKALHKHDKLTKILAVIGVPKRFGLIHEGGILSSGSKPPVISVCL